MIHYHGTPVTPKSALEQLAGRHFCVSFARPDNIERCAAIGQSIMLDNGAFSYWRTGKATDWDAYYAWCEKWLAPGANWAVIPDVIDGDEKQNDRLIEAWPHGHRGAPVWHLHEPIERLLRLCSEWPRVCFGSSGTYSKVGTRAWHTRMREAFNPLCGDGPAPLWLHMLRGMALSRGPYPFASVDSTDIARNHSRPQNTVRSMADRWDAMQPPALWRTDLWDPFSSQFETTEAA